MYSTHLAILILLNPLDMSPSFLAVANCIHQGLGLLQHLPTCGLLLLLVAGVAQVLVDEI
jgi:hypothetical protein